MSPDRCAAAYRVLEEIYHGSRRLPPEASNECAGAGEAGVVCEEAAREPLLRASNADMVTASCEQQRSELVTLDRWARRSIYQDERQL